MTLQYVIVEKRSSEISFVWKTVHICLYLSCAIVSMVLSNSVGIIWSQFDTNCLLNSNLFFKSANHSQETQMACSIDNVQTQWSKNYGDCNAHFMVYLLLFCASVIMLTYFVFLNVGSHAANSQMISSWRILWIATLVNAIAFIVATVDARSVVRSVLSLCRSFPDAKDPKTLPCSTDCLVYNEVDQSFLSTSLNFLVILPWLSVLLWGLSLAWCVIRMLYHPDFSVYRVTKVDAQEGEDSSPEQGSNSNLDQSSESRPEQASNSNLHQSSKSRPQQGSTRQTIHLSSVPVKLEMIPSTSKEN